MASEGYSKYSDIFAVLGVTIAFFGMVVSWGSESWSDTLPTPWGLLDELMGTALFGAAFSQAFYVDTM